jgi:hypothetical protein
VPWHVAVIATISCARSSSISGLPDDFGAGSGRSSLAATSIPITFTSMSAGCNPACASSCNAPMSELFASGVRRGLALTLCAPVVRIHSTAPSSFGENSSYHLDLAEIDSKTLTDCVVIAVPDRGCDLPPDAGEMMTEDCRFRILAERYNRSGVRKWPCVAKQPPFDGMSFSPSSLRSSTNRGQRTPPWLLRFPTEILQHGAR